MTDRDRSDPLAGIVCVPLEDVTESAKLAYYAARLLELFAV
jgi:hypothetical protein